MARRDLDWSSHSATMCQVIQAVRVPLWVELIVFHISMLSLCERILIDLCFQHDPHSQLLLLMKESFIRAGRRRKTSLRNGLAPYERANSRHCCSG